MRIVLLGPPGSGKGTQGELLAKKFNLPRLSVGALIRRHYDEKSTLGIEAGKYMLKGLGIPAKILIAMLDAWISVHPEGFVIDNIVRTKEQLDEFNKFQKKKSLLIDKVFYLKISENEAIKRLTRRIQEKNRPDEAKEAICKRFSIFYMDMNLIFDYFRKQGIFFEINGEQTIEKVHEEIMGKI